MVSRQRGAGNPRRRPGGPRSVEVAGGDAWAVDRVPSRPRARGADTGVRELADEAEGLEWVWVSDKAFADDDEALVYAIRAQSTRRNLEPGELLRCIKRLDDIRLRPCCKTETGWHDSGP